TKTATINAS
nr:Chain F, PROTEIN (9-MER) [synthetic construct]